MKASILTICINYKNNEETRAFVEELLIQDFNEKHDILVVDNVDSESIVSTPFEEMNDESVTVLRPYRNLGYFGAASWAMKQYSSSNEMPRWVIVCNTDLTLSSKDFLSSLIDKYRDEAPSIIAPAIISKKTLLDQNPHSIRRPTFMKLKFMKIVFSNIVTMIAYENLSRWKSLIAIHYSSDREIDTSHRSRMQIYAPHGSFIIFNEEYFHSGGTLDYGAFLFGEELFVAETARELGLEILYDPTFIVLHSEHSTTNISRTRAKYKAEASKYCAETLFTRERQREYIKSKRKKNDEFS